MTSNRKPHKTVPSFLRPAYKKKGENANAAEAFAQQAQAALDAVSRTETPSPSTYGAQYRRGVTLAELRPGECGFVHHLLGTPQRRLRLLEMGLTVGTHVQVLRIAAF